MAKVRIGFSTHFEIENELAGIGTDNPTNTKQVLGNIKSSDAKVIGITTLTTFDGFTDTKLNLHGSVGSKQHTTSSEIIIEGEVTVSSGTTYTSGLENLTVTDNFTLPGISDDKPTVGTTRFNENLRALEFYTGVEWRAVNSYVDMGNAGRALFGGGDDAVGKLSNISSLQFMTLGNAVTFGDLTVARTNPGGCSSEIRAVFAGGEAPSANNTIDYNAIASGGTGADFGNLLSNHRYKVGCSSSTRGLFGAGSTPSATNVIEYVEISTTGDAVDFGDLMGNGMINSGSFASPTRGFFVDKAVSLDQECQVVTIASKGNTISYLPQGLPGGLNNGDAGRGCSNSTRGIFVGAGQTKNIDCVDLVSDGITYDFGDMTQAKYGVGCSASPLRGVLYGGWTPTRQNTIEYVTFESMGDAVDFGDATHAIRETASNVSDCHGGLGGF